ncbi:Mg-protoporphyrin IX methyl transferase [Burkholderiaceae bacterium]|jgi:magnesium-protoporphyrin O-methyltransferase
MQHRSYIDKRNQLEQYFDRTAVDAWARLTSSAPVSGIRATVRAGRETMRQTILAYLPADLSGKRVLDAGCGTGLLAVDLARRGAQVVAIDISPTLVQLGKERLPNNLNGGSIEFLAGDMLDPALGQFDYVVCMDSMIHYNRFDIAKALGLLAVRTRQTIVFTFAPKTIFLAALIGVGRLFPRGDRAPFIEPVAEKKLTKLIVMGEDLGAWTITGSKKISRGFYKSQAMALERQ